MGLQNDFAEEGPFHNKPLISQRVPFGCKIISQRSAIFARGSFGLQNFAGLCNSLLLILFGSLRPSFTSFVIPPKLDHSKSLRYIKIT